MAVDINLTKKQSQAWRFLWDDKTREVLFGAGAGSGKSFLGCLWIITLSQKYPGTRYLIGRSVLTQLKLTTLKTLLETLQRMNFKSEEHYTFNQQSNVLTFSNGSEIILKDLQQNPGDPSFDSLGSIEITAAFIDEASQISALAKHIILSRIRYKLNEYNLIPKLYMSCNPGQNFLKAEFYLPWKEGSLDPRRQFIPATAYDNSYLPDSYIETLENLPEQQKQRLLLGNWDYTQDINALFSYDKIVESYFRFAPDTNEKKYLSVDVARLGSDKSVVTIWVGLCVIDMKIFKQIDTQVLTKEVLELMQIHGIHPSQVIIDADGIGGAIVDNIRGKSFVNNARPFNNMNFSNLKSQCYFKLSELFKEGLISININNPILTDELTQELLAIRLKDVDKDNKVQVASKDEQKRILGKSPDHADSLMLRMLAEVSKTTNTGKYSIMFV